jgi:hypothetical protein
LQAALAAQLEEVGDLIRGTSDLLATYTDDQLRVIQDFLDRARQLTAAYADALGGERTKVSGPSPLPGGG